MLQAHWITDVDEMNVLGVEFLHRTTISFLILEGIEAIRLVPKSTELDSQPYSRE